MPALFLAYKGGWQNILFSIYSQRYFPKFRFTPEKLGMLATNAMFYMLLENIIVFVTKYLLNISQSLNVWHALAYSSYKYVGYFSNLVLFLFLTDLNSNMSWIFLTNIHLLKLEKNFLLFLSPLPGKVEVAGL